MAKRADLELEFFPFFVDAFLEATKTWPSQRVGAYVRLLSHQWKTGSVPGDDLEELGPIIAVVGESIDVAQIWDRLKAKFPKGDKGYQNRKLEEVRADVLRRMKTNKRRTEAATEAAAESRRKKSRNGDGDRHASVTGADATSVTTDKSGNSESLEIENLPPQPAQRAGLVELSSSSREAIEGILRSLTVPDCATPERFHAAMAAGFRALGGWSFESRVHVDNRGDGRGGVIDLVVHRPERIAIELDRNMPREKSIEKVLTLADAEGYAPVVICRTAPAPGWWTERRGVEVWGLGEEPEPQFTKHRRPH